MTARERILACAPSTGQSMPRPTVFPRTCFDGADLWEAFRSKLVELGAEPIDLKDFKADQTVYVEPAARPFTELKSTAPLWKAEVGISLADFAIAETGSLIVTTMLGQERLSTLLPPVNLVIVHRIVPTLFEALSQLPPGNVAIITGPSRTADIEGKLVRGVHGPGRLLVVTQEEE